MLANVDAVATVGVRDVVKAREFYGSVLGLRELGGDGPAEVLMFESGGSRIQVYRSDYAGTNQATAITWDVGDRIEEVAAALKQKGARFEHYSFEGMRLEGDIHVMDAMNMKALWLKDPDGNILSINGR